MNNMIDLKLKMKIKGVLLIALTICLVACGGEESIDGSIVNQGTPPVTPAPTAPPPAPENNGPVDPSDSVRLSSALIVPNSNRVQGAMPVSSNTSNQPQITRSEQSLAYSPASQVLLPIDYQSPSGTNITEVVFSVVGANDYFSISTTNAGASGTIVLPIDLPNDMSDGRFCVNIKLIDSNALVSSEQQVCVNISQPLACDVRKVSGGEGITNTVHTMDGNTGSVKIDYETFTVKDKIDVFQNGVWIAGTGVYTDRTSIRTALNCSQATESLGYVGQNSEFLFGYDALLGGHIEVMVSGCENNGTAWNYTASCPGDYGFCAVDSECAGGEVCLSGKCAGQGTLRFSLKWSALADYDLYVITPQNTLIGFNGSRSADGGEWDIDNTIGGPGAAENIFFNDTLGTGTYTVYVDNYSGDAGSWTIEVFINNVKTELFSGTFTGQGDEESGRFTIEYR